MQYSDDPLETIWDGLLSQDPSMIKRVYNTLNSDSQNNVLLHLQRMMSEAGWLPIQRQSAQIALDVLRPIEKDDHSTQE